MNPSLERTLAALDFDGIAANFKVIMTLNPPRVDVYHRALRALEHGLAREPGNARLHALQGKALSNLSRYPEARAALERSLMLDGRDARARAWLGEVHLLESRIEAALSELNATLALDPGCAWAYFYRAASRFARGETALAARDLRLLAGLGSAHDARSAAEAFLSLMDAKAGRVKSALARIDAVRARHPAQSWPLVLRATVNRMRGDRRAALKDLDAALAGREAGWLYLERAALREELGLLEEAAADLCAAEKWDGPSEHIFQRRGRVLAALGDRLFQEGDLLLRRGRYTEAGAVLRAAVRAGAVDCRIHESLGSALEQTGRAAAAEAAYEKACALKPDRLQPYLKLAGLRLARGDARGMTSALKLAARRIPDVSGGGVTALIERFQLSLCLRRNADAARAGELLLDRTREHAHLERLNIPLLPGFDGAAMPPHLIAYGLRCLRVAARDARRSPESPWSGYIHELWLARFSESETPRLTVFPAGRYGWMRARPGYYLLYEGRFREAVVHLRAARDFTRPPDWRCQCLIAEALIFQEQVARARRAFRSAEKWAGAARGEVLAWEGAALLWCGRSREALEVLNSIPAGSPSPYALCWKGAALCQLRRYGPALAALDAAIASFPRDSEARIWRAEALLRTGRSREAIVEADASIACRIGQHNSYARAVRGLARAAAGDRAGLREDFAKVSSRLIAAARRRLGAGGGEAEILEEVLELSRGVRRADVHHARWLA